MSEVRIQLAYCKLIALRMVIKILFSGNEKADNITIPFSLLSSFINELRTILFLLYSFSFVDKKKDAFKFFVIKFLFI